MLSLYYKLRRMRRDDALAKGRSDSSAPPVETPQSLGETKEQGIEGTQLMKRTSREGSAV